MLAERLLKTAQCYKDKVAVIVDDRSYTYSALFVDGDKTGVPEIDAITSLPTGPLPPFALHTTGTTGKSKDVLISERAVLANTENLIHGQRYTPDLVFIIAGSMAHLGCWSKIFPVFLVGGTLLVLRDGMKDINAFYRALDLPLTNYNLSPTTKFATFLVPSNIRILLQFSKDRLADYDSRIDFIETGAAAMPLADMQRLCGLLPSSRLYNTYASTETGIIATYDFNAGECIAGCLGMPLPHSHIIITPEGYVACQGDTLMDGYRDAPELTAEVMRNGTVFTHDRGYLDSEGRLRLIGRDDDIINAGGYKVNPVDVEDAAMAIEGITDCICIARPHPILGMAPVLLVVTNDTSFSKRNVAISLRQSLQPHMMPVDILSVEAIARTFNGKLNRKHYRENDS